MDEDHNESHEKEMNEVMKWRGDRILNATKGDSILIV